MVQINISHQAFWKNSIIRKMSLIVSAHMVLINNLPSKINTTW